MKLILTRDRRTNIVYNQIVKKRHKQVKVGDSFELKLKLFLIAEPRVFRNTKTTHYHLKPFKQRIIVQVVKVSGNLAKIEVA